MVLGRRRVLALLGSGVPEILGCCSMVACGALAGSGFGLLARKPFVGAVVGGILMAAVVMLVATLGQLLPDR